MKNKLWFKRFMDVATDGTEGGAGGGSVSGDPANKEVGAEGESGKEQATGDDSGKSKLSDDAATLLKENLRRKEKIKELEATVSQANEKLKQFEGIDPVAVKELLAKREEEENKALEAKGDFDRLKQKMAEQHAAEKATLQQQLSDLQGKFDGALGNINELTIGAQFSNSNYIKENLLMTPNKAKVVYAPHFDFENGSIVGYDKPKGSANRTPLVDASGNALSFDLAMQKLIEADPEKDSLLRSTIKPGAGSSTEQTNKFDTGDKKALTGVDKINAGLKALVTKA
jgi:hypothetical protein